MNHAAEKNRCPGTRLRVPCPVPFHHVGMATHAPFPSPQPIPSARRIPRGACELPPIVWELFAGPRASSVPWQQSCRPGVQRSHPRQRTSSVPFPVPFHSLFPVPFPVQGGNSPEAFRDLRNFSRYPPKPPIWAGFCFSWDG